MTDAFAMLGQPRRPWLEPDAVRSRFHELAIPIHPDRVHGAPAAEREAATARYAELNAAHQTLRETRSRLAHLIELETAAPPRDIQRLPPGVMDLFVEVGQACRDADEFLARKAAASSPMLRLAVLRELPTWLGRLTALLQQVRARQDALDGELAGMNGAWEAAPPPEDAGRRGALPLERLEQLYRASSYAFRWAGQIQDRISQLAA